MVSIEYPVHGGFYESNAPIEYRVQVADREDEVIAEERVTVQPLLGHNTHTRLLPTEHGPDGSFMFQADDLQEQYIFDRFGILEVSYTDEGTRGAKSLTATDRTVLQPNTTAAVVHV